MVFDNGNTCAVGLPSFLSGRFQPIAHRGGAGASEATVENTLSAFRYAYDLGFRYFETDVHATADGVPVIFHDALLSRVADTAGSISDLSLESLRQIKFGNDERIPTVSELLQAFPDVAFNLDIKADEAATPLARVIAEEKASDRVLVTSFLEKRLQDFLKVASPTPALGAPTSVVVKYLAHFKLGLPAPKFPAVVLQVPVKHGRIQVVTRQFVDGAHKRGLKVHVWTIDERAQMERLIDLGVDGIMTDRPDVLKEVALSRDLFT